MVEYGYYAILHAHEASIGTRVEALVDVVRGVEVVVGGIGKIVVRYYSVLRISVGADILVLIGMRTRCLTFFAAEHTILSCDGGSEQCGKFAVVGRFCKSLLCDFFMVVYGVGCASEYIV